MTMSSAIETRVEYVGARTARARFLDGVLRVRMPRHWPADQQEEVLTRFRRWATRQAERVRTLPPLEAWDGRRWGEAEFGAYVRRLNEETLRAPLAGVRIGRARHTRLAQANTRTGVLTFSRFAIDGMPERALRYLVLHELAHLFEANHSARFWALVARHEPDWKAQRVIAQAHHARMVEGPHVQPGDHPGGEDAQGVAAAAGATSAAGGLPYAPAPTLPNERVDDPDAHPFGPLFAFVPGR